MTPSLHSAQQQRRNDLVLWRGQRQYTVLWRRYASSAMLPTAKGRLSLEQCFLRQRLCSGSYYHSDGLLDRGCQSFEHIRRLITHCRICFVLRSVQASYPRSSSESSSPTSNNNRSSNNGGRARDLGLGLGLPLATLLVTIVALFHRRQAVLHLVVHAKEKLQTQAQSIHLNIL